MNWIRRVKWLTQALIISGTINIGLVATFVYFVLKEKQTSVVFESKPYHAKPVAPSQLTNEKILRSYVNSSFQDLLLNLENKELLEEGLTKRDLALACLVAFHNFNLERALGGLALHQRQIALNSSDSDEKIDLIVFPGLADYQYQAIVYYAKTEKWPLTSSGLFYEIKQSPKPIEPALFEAFYLTPEFHAVSTLFSRSGVNCTKDAIVEMLALGEWSSLQTFCTEQKQAQDLSPERLRHFLLEYLTVRSSLAARVLLEKDYEFVLRRLNDTQILVFFDVLNEKTTPLENLAKDLLTSPRSDLVIQKAHSLVPVLSSPVVLPVIKEKKIHVIQDGDSLWKIARKYKVSIEEIKKINHLETEKLRAGRQLEIP